MDWWLWILFGAVLLAAELFLPADFFFAFFGVAAMLVGILEIVGLAASTSVQWLLFSVLAIALTLGFRKRLRVALQRGGAQGVIPGSLVGDVVIVAEEVAEGGVGKAELRGTSWTVRSAGPGVLRAGQRCRVERVDGLTLYVRAAS